MSDTTQSGRIFTPQERRRCLIAISAGTASAGMGFGMTLPLVSLLMERQQANTTLIALMGGMYALTAVIFMPLIPKIIGRISTYQLMSGAALLGSVSMFSMMLTDDFWFWFLSRFAMAIGGITLMTLAEIWLNQVAEDETRGRYMGTFGAALSAGFALGPLIIQFTGVGGHLPFVVGGTLMACALIPLSFARNLTPKFVEKDSAGFWGFLFVAPAATFAALTYGAIETGAFSLLPLYAVRNGFTEETAAIFMTLLGVETSCSNSQLVGWRTVSTPAWFSSAALPWALSPPWLCRFSFISLGCFTQASSCGAVLLSASTQSA